MAEIIDFPGMAKRPFDKTTIVAVVLAELGCSGVLEAAIVDATDPRSVSSVTTLHYLGGDEDTDSAVDDIMTRFEWPDDGAQQYHSPTLPRMFPFS